MDCKCYLLPQCCLKQQGKDQCINIFMKESNNRPFGEDFWVGARGTVGNDGGKERMGCSRKEVQIFFFCGSCLLFLASHSLFPLPWSLRELSEKSFDFWLTPWILIRRNSLKYPCKKHDNLTMVNVTMITFCIISLLFFWLIIFPVLSVAKC